MAWWKSGAWVGEHICQAIPHMLSELCTAVNERQAILDKTETLWQTKGDPKANPSVSDFIGLTIGNVVITSNLAALSGAIEGLLGANAYNAKWLETSSGPEWDVDSLIESAGYGEDWLSIVGLHTSQARPWLQIKNCLDNLIYLEWPCTTESASWLWKDSGLGILGEQVLWDLMLNDSGVVNSGSIIDYRLMGGVGAAVSVVIIMGTPFVNRAVGRPWGSQEIFLHMVGESQVPITLTFYGESLSLNATFNYSDGDNNWSVPGPGSWEFEMPANWLDETPKTITVSTTLPALYPFWPGTQAWCNSYLFSVTPAVGKLISGTHLTYG